MRLFTDTQVERFLIDGWWTGTDWVTLLQQHAATRPDHLSLVDPPNRASLTDGVPRRWTWADVDAEVGRLAAVMFANGVRADDVVGVQLPNVVELAVAYLALARLGAIATPFPVQYREHELNMLLPVVGARAFMTATNVLGRDNAAAVAALRPDIESLATVFAWGTSPPDDTVALDGAVVGEADAAAFRAYVDGRHIHLNDCITVCWTSGTESIPKGIPRAFGDWAAVGAGCIEAPSLTGGDVIMNPFPLVNMGAFGGLFTPWIRTGCTLVQHHPFDLGVFLGQIAGERVTYTVVPPAILTRLLQEPQVLDNFDLSSLRAVGTGSAPVPSVTIRGWEARGIEVINFFGSNEGINLISDRSSVPDPDQRGVLFPSYRGDPSKLRVSGAAHTRIRLVDATTGQDVDEPGRPGELCLSGPTVFAGYFPGTGKPNAFDDQGFYRTGDLFEFADDSLELLRYRGRATDMIVRGGFNISPAEVENALQEHPDVAEVAIVGLPDDVLGERICAFVVPAGGASPTLQDLTEFMDRHQVAKFKWPERVELIDALPRNPVGKVLHRELRNRLDAAPPA